MIGQVEMQGRTQALQRYRTARRMEAGNVRTDPPSGGSVWSSSEAIGSPRFIQRITQGLLWACRELLYLQGSGTTMTSQWSNHLRLSRGQCTLHSI